jgi:hypothetical protein
VLSICQYLASPGGNITITNNATGCDSPQEVEQACEWVSIEEPTTLTSLEVYPNPASSIISVEWEGPSVKKVELSILTIGGQLVMKQLLTSPRNDIDIRFLQPGIYVISLQSATSVDTRKLFVK